MFGAFISDDYYFFLDSDVLIALADSRNTFIGEFVCKNNTTGPQHPEFLRMKLSVSIDYGDVKNPPSSRINIHFKKKQCFLVFSKLDFDDWFVSPNEYVRRHGPNWRYASANVYIKSDLSEDFQNFRNDIISFMAQAPESPRPPRKKLR